MDKKEYKQQKNQSYVSTDCQLRRSPVPAEPSGTSPVVPQLGLPPTFE